MAKSNCCFSLSFSTRPENRRRLVSQDLRSSSDTREMGVVLSCFSNADLAHRQQQQRRQAAGNHPPALSAEVAAAIGIGSEDKSGNGRSERKGLDEAVLTHEQALAAVLLLRQNGGAPGESTFDKSSSLRVPGHGQKRQVLPRSSSSRPRSLVDPVMQPQLLVNQDLKVDNLETKHFVLVHGGGFGAWCWYKSIALLEDSGFKVSAIDLTGSGISSFDTNKVTSLAEYAKPLTSFLETLGDMNKVCTVLIYFKIMFLVDSCSAQAKYVVLAVDWHVGRPTLTCTGSSSSPPFFSSVTIATLLPFPCKHLCTFAVIRALLASLRDLAKPLSCKYTSVLSFVLSSLISQVILVGHDFGGACVSYAMEVLPSKVAKSIFICAAMPINGQNILDMFSEEAGMNDLMRQAQVFVYSNGQDLPPTAIDLDKSLLKELLFNQSPSKDVALALVSMRSIPFAPVLEKLSLTEKNYGSVRRFFIETTDDNAMPLPVQQRLSNVNPPEKVFRLKGSDHSPFFSKPQALHKILVEIATMPSNQS
ncbi:hypothetical protein ZIOFF_054683 [Zingiber officinale]|uniref:AB hydrolase-1 domain-containing protein n=1 Tax=Zingiber officinale TaxID=94328 RepID=A0A8J5FI21_ZINOF|nr:hypothetical protein ZIOFF_054683 [Zingiber officinale]